MIKKITVLLAAVALSGCSTVYKYQGQTYDSKDKFYSAIDNHVSQVLATITPLPKQLTQRTLIFAIPSAVAFTEQDRKNFIQREHKDPSEQQVQTQLTLNQGNFKNIKVFFDAIQKRNIYASTRFIEMDSTSGSFAAAPDTDTLYFIAPAPNTSQWFYTSHKHGKQIFAADRSSPTAEGKVLAFVEAVQAQAIRD